MDSGHSQGHTRPHMTRKFREKRALMACTHCRRLKKRCKPAGSTGCQRCQDSGKLCQYLNVPDDDELSSPLSRFPFPPLRITGPHVGASDTNPSQHLPSAQYIPNILHNVPQQSFHTEWSPYRRYQIPPSCDSMSATSTQPHDLNFDDQQTETPIWPPSSGSQHPSWGNAHHRTSANATNSTWQFPDGASGLDALMHDARILTPQSPHGASSTASSQDNRIYNQDCLFCDAGYTPSSHGCPDLNYP